MCLTSKNLPIQLQKKMGIKHLFLLRMSEAANVEFVSGFCKFANANVRLYFKLLALGDRVSNFDN